MENNNRVYPMAEQLRRFHEGEQFCAWEWFGAHAEIREDCSGTVFRLWAPHAVAVSVICESNGWDRERNPMTRMEEDSSIWICFIPGVNQFDSYKYSICTQNGQVLDKSDPFAFHAETRPYTASKIYNICGYEWHDRAWMHRQKLDEQPINIYEVHLGSWKLREDDSFYSYRELADRLVPYACDMGYTHLEFLPVMEHPFDGSWGYQALGWFAATSRYGTPHDLMYLIDRCHQAGLGVILDWSAAGFPSDVHGLYQFDGAACYECEPPDDEMPYGMRRFDFSRGEVVSFLLSSAMFWISQYHVDGLRVSTVEPMLYLDYAREDGCWTANKYGENVNLDGARFLRTLCDCVAQQYPDVWMIASNTGLWPSVTKPTCCGGLGFSHMWRDDWVQQALQHAEELPYNAEDFSDWLTLTLVNSMNERYVLPLSHDVVSHGDGSLLARMPGTYHEKFARLRTLYGAVMAHPGDKLLFMGSEFAQFTEWAYHHGLDWMLLEYETHRQMREYVRGLNLFYKYTPPLWEWKNSTDAFVWVDRGTQIPGLLAFERKSPDETILVIINFTAQRVSDYQLTLQTSQTWEEVFSSDDISYGGNGVKNETLIAIPIARNEYQVTLDIEPYSVQFFSPVTK